MSALAEFTRGSGIAAATALLCAGTPAAVTATELPFSEAQLFFELNETDGDLGIHAKIDGGPWKQLEIEDKNERTILSILSLGRLRRQGMTEIFFESAEPPFDELPPEQFFLRFPEGVYEVSGITQSGAELESEMVISHVMPAPAGNIRIGSNRAAEDCDAPNLPTVPGNQTLRIKWDPVTTSHPEIGKSGPVSIAEYEVIIEAGDIKLAANLPPNVTRLYVPAPFLTQSDEWKLEVLARATNLNRTAIETCFKVQ